METSVVRRKLHEYVNKSDDKLIQLMYALTQEYNGDEDFEYEFSDEDIKLFNERRSNRLSSESKTYSWEEAKTIINRKEK